MEACARACAHRLACASRRRLNVCASRSVRDSNPAARASSCVSSAASCASRRASVCRSESRSREREATCAPGVRGCHARGCHAGAVGCARGEVAGAWVRARGADQGSQRRRVPWESVGRASGGRAASARPQLRQPGVRAWPRHTGRECPSAGEGGRGGRPERAAGLACCCCALATSAAVMSSARIRAACAAVPCVAERIVSASASCSRFRFSYLGGGGVGRSLLGPPIAREVREIAGVRGRSRAVAPVDHEDHVVFSPLQPARRVYELRRGGDHLRLGSLQLRQHHLRAGGETEGEGGWGGMRGRGEGREGPKRGGGVLCCVARGACSCVARALQCGVAVGRCCVAVSRARGVACGPPSSCRAGGRAPWCEASQPREE